MSRIIEDAAATSGLTSGRRRQHQRNRFFVGINVSSAVVLYVPTPQMFSYWQAAACPRAARKSATCRSPRSRILAALVPSVGTIASNKEFGSRAGAHERPGIRASLTDPCVSSQGKEIRAPQRPCLITSVKTNPTCAVSNAAGTRLKMTATLLLDLFPVSRNAARKSVSRRTGRWRLSCNKGRTEHNRSTGIRR